MNNQNLIVQSSFQFGLLSSNFESWYYKNVNKDDSLIILKELDLTKAAVVLFDIPHHSAFAGKASAQYAWVCLPNDGTYWEVYNQAKEEFEKAKKIKGYEALNLETMDRLWISHYDVKLLFNNKERIS